MSRNGPSILFVEDEVLIRLGAIDIVRSAGFEALEAANADIAISILGSHTRVGVVITDVDMPGSMDGIGLARYIHTHWPDIKLIVVSGKQVLPEIHLPPGTMFLGKPYLHGEIAGAVAQMLGWA